MAKFKSPGQKRKGIVRIVSLLIFVAATYAGSLVLAFFNTGALSWIDNHTEVSASIIELNHYEEETRNLKGRKRTSDYYEVSYLFTVEQEEYENTVSIDYSDFSSVTAGEEITVWYDTSDPYISDTKANAQSDVNSNTTVGNMVGVAPYSAPLTLFIYWLLQIIFVRESKKSLPQGFYTEKSWLDIDDNYVVAIDNDDLVFFNIHEKQAGNVQDAYQNDAPLEELIAISQSSNFKRIPLNEITALSSNHNSDVFVIEHGEDSHSVEFLNQTVKAHALEAVKKCLPESLNYTKQEKSRIESVTPSVLFLLVLIVTAVALDIFVLNLIIVFISLVYVLPRVFSRAIDPTITEHWGNTEEQEMPKHQTA